MTDQKLDISVGHAANSKSWKNQKWNWPAIAEKLKTATHTNETIAEFLGASKEEQGKIKDVGGFVGGFLRNGRRKPANVLHRQILALDIDFAEVDFWDDFTMQFSETAILHGTHKHTKENPRYRLIMPLSREASPDEYVALARQIAGNLGIDYFDSTTFQTERLMFWPSSPKDVEYYAVEQIGDWLDVDQVLASYTDWRDSSSWPTAESQIKGVKDLTLKQEDPESKGGIIGAFCRTYSITEAIDTFLSELYVHAEGDRYTYVNGSAAAGLVTYDDKFAFSHHGTDPAGGSLCNAFDLVRIHKFGHLDPDNYNGTNSKSFTAMNDFCREDVAVKKTVALEKVKEAGVDFNDSFEDEDEDIAFDKMEVVKDSDVEWMLKLKMDKQQNYLSTAGNLKVIFENDVNLKGVFQENLFDDKKYVFRSVPWRKIKEPETIRSVDLSGIRSYLEGLYGIVSPPKIADALELAFNKCSFHPIKEYLSSLKWDGDNRIDRLLIDYFGADDNIYTHEAIRVMLTGAVARIYRPGCKFDLVLTLVGNKQGTGKSTFISKLGKQWFSDSFHTVEGTAAFEQLKGAWIIEMAELAGVRRAKVEATKHFITKQEDSYRPAYGHVVETYKRRCVFFATTNEDNFLTDATGNRRFMPIDVHEESITKNILDADEMTGAHVDQVWAEAVELFKAKSSLYLSKEAEKIAKREQLDHSQSDSRQGIVEDYLATLLPKNWNGLDLNQRRTFLSVVDDFSEGGTVERELVCVAEIWCECLGKEKHEMDNFKTRGINDIMKSSEDWQHHNTQKNFGLYGRQKYYSRK